jgi:hypothetical protein
VRLRAGERDFDFFTKFRLPLGLTQTPIQWVPGGVFQGVKRPGRDADHSPPSSAGAVNAWNYTSIFLPGVVLS